MTNRRHRFRRFAKWMGTILSALILALWILSIPIVPNGGLQINYFDTPRVWSIYCGAAHWSLLPQLGEPPGFQVSGGTSPRNRWDSFGICLPSHTFRPGALEWYSVPLWIPFLIAGIPTAILWHRDRRQIPPGHCPPCDYNLTGNTSGVCPECGAAVNTNARSKTLMTE